MIDRLTRLGDPATVAILEVILREEIAHVAAGTRWFHHLCAQRGLVPQPTFLALLERHARDVLRGPFNREARRQAGFDDAEMDALLRLDGGAPAA